MQAALGAASLQVVLKKPVLQVIEDVPGSSACVESFTPASPAPQDAPALASLVPSERQNRDPSPSAMWGV